MIFLYVGADYGVYVTIVRGKSWNYLGSGLPDAPVWDLQIHPRDNMLVIATNGWGYGSSMTSRSSRNKSNSFWA